MSRAALAAAYLATTYRVDAPRGPIALRIGERSAALDGLLKRRGACACATCHVHVDEAWRAAVGEPSPMEEDMLDFGYDVRPNSRLSCQIKVSAELDGLIVRTPERQA